MTEYSAADMQVAVSRIAAANMSQAPYPLTTEQWAALRSAPATIERLEARQTQRHTQTVTPYFNEGMEAAAKIADRCGTLEDAATAIRAEIKS